MKARTGSVVKRIAVGGFLMVGFLMAGPTLAVPFAGKKPRRAAAPGARPESVSACVNMTLGCNTGVVGQLTTDDCLILDDGSYYDRWFFEASAVGTVRITMQAGFDTYLWLYDPDGELVAVNDDIVPEENLNSRIDFAIDKTGTWTIWANSYDEGVTGVYSLDLSCSGVAPPPPTCVGNSTALCLNDSRFRVQVSWRVPSQGTSGAGMAQTLTSDTGDFWFFSSNNIELVVKVVDGRAFNNHFWVFYGALSDVEYTITVTDTATGTVKTYSNPFGRLASVADAAAFPSGTPGTTAESAELSGAGAELVEAEVREIASLVAPETALACTPSPAALCLNNSRFRVQVSWSVPNQGTSGVGTAVTLTSDTGYFWFFSSNNVELVLKVVDGRTFNNYFWVFYGALSSVQYAITVTDTETGVVRTYTNPDGNVASVADTAAFQ